MKTRKRMSVKTKRVDFTDTVLEESCKYTLDEGCLGSCGRREGQQLKKLPVQKVDLGR